jgi:hypothetical protein
LHARLPHLTALIAGAAAALAVGCGDERSNLVPAGQATALKDELASIRSAVDDGRCAEAAAAFQRAVEINTQLPLSVDLRLRRRLAGGLTSLGRHLAEDCAAAQIPTVTTETTPTATETTPTETVPTETTPAETSTGAPPTTSTTTTVTPTTETPSTPTTETPTTSDPGTGGAPGDGTGTP